VNDVPPINHMQLTALRGAVDGELWASQFAAFLYRISAIENGRVNLEVERAKVFANALQCHPAVLRFPG
jgi:hypothetical protein